MIQYFNAHGFKNFQFDTYTPMWHLKKYIKIIWNFNLVDSIKLLHQSLGVIN